MADAKGKGGGGLKKKVGPLPIWGWAVAGGGGFLVYRYLRARSAASASLAATGTTGGGTTGTIPAGTSGASGTATSGGAGTFSSITQWQQALLTFLTGNGMTPAQAFTATSRFLNGNCVGKTAYDGISAALVSSSVGLPPGFSSNLPTLSLCATNTQTGGKQPAPNPQVVLPWLNSSLFSPKVLYGQYAPGDYTQIGVVNNGQYQGASVQGGAPVYAGVFGGFVQGFNWATLPNGTGIYVPTSLLDYVTGHTPAGATVATHSPAG